MKLIELKDGYVLGMWDIPSPDNWTRTYLIIYNFPLDSKLYEEMINLDDPKRYSSKGNLQFYDMFAGNIKDAQQKQKKYEKIPVEIRNKINNILQNSKAFSQFDLFISNINVDEELEKRTTIEELRTKGIPPIPLDVKGLDKWDSLTREQRRHNKLVESGKDGLPSILKQYPAMKGKEFKPDGRLLRIKWETSEKLFSNQDKIKNPKWIKYDKLSQINTNVSIPSQVKEFIPVSSAFSSARNVLNHRLKKKSRIQESIYYLTVDNAYAPNIIDKHGNPAYDRTKPPAQFSWDITKEEFVGDINGKPPIRLPDDPNANTFEEILYAEFMPPFELLKAYMHDANGKIKEKYKYGYNTYLRGSIHDWVAILHQTPADEKEFTKQQIKVNESLLIENPDIFSGEDKVKDVIDRFDEYVIDDLIGSGMGHLANWVDLREEWYKEKINTGYNFADVITDNNLKEYLQHYNKIIIAFNKKTGANKPLLKSHLPKPSDKGKIGEWNKKVEEQELFMVRELLKKKGWYYTIPNEDYSMEENFLENKTILDRRKEFEFKLFSIRQKFDEDSKKPTNIYKQVILKGEFEDILNKGDIDTLINYYKRMITEPEGYSRPETYKTWLEEMIPKEKLPKEAELKKSFQENARKEKDAMQKEEQAIEKIINEVFDILQFKRALDRDDVESAV